MNHARLDTRQPIDERDWAAAFAQAPASAAVHPCGNPACDVETSAVYCSPTCRLQVEGAEEPEPDGEPDPGVRQGCPEALFSLTLKGALDGHETLLTVRGQTPAQFQANLAVVRGLLDPVPTPPAQAAPGEGWCPTHQVRMQQNHKNGRTWLSHRLADGQWCKGK
jgi:hypothetical protein